MTTIELSCNGGYVGIDDAVGKKLEATLTKAGYMVTATALREAGGDPCMHEYLFFKQEVKAIWQA